MRICIAADAVAVAVAVAETRHHPFENCCVDAVTPADVVMTTPVDNETRAEMLEVNAPAGKVKPPSVNTPAFIQQLTVYAVPEIKLTDWFNA